MSRWVGWVVVVLAVIAFGWYVVRSTMEGAVTRCEVCLEFDGEQVCRVGSGPTEREARAAAQESACGGNAPGMAESIACRNQPPVSVSCPAS